MSIRLVTLGGLDVRAPDGTAIRSVLAQPKRAAMLAYLAVREPIGFHARNHVAATFWPESDDARARGALRTAVHYLRTSLGADALLTRGDDELGLNPDRIWCDAVAMLQAFEAGRFEEGLELYRGELLQGVLLPDADEFNEWLDARRRQLRWQAVDAARQLVEQSTRPADAVRWARRWLELAPFEEAAIRAVVAAHAAAGERALAIEELETWRARLERELGAQPGAETLALADTLREPQPAKPMQQHVAGDVVIATPARASTMRVRPTRRVLLTAVAVLTVAAAAAVAGVFARTRVPPAAEEAVAVVLPFSYGGNPQLAYLRTGMVDLLSTELNRTGVVRAVDPRSVLTRVGDSGAPVSPDAARSIARAFNARYYVLGSMVELNGTMQVAAALHRTATGQPVKTLSYSAAVDSLFAIVDYAASELLRSDIQRGTGINADADGVRTKSIAAMLEFIAGEQAFASSQWDAAAAAYERAIALDSTFARAHLRKAMVGQWHGGQRAIDGGINAALRFEQNLSADDRTLLHAYHAHIVLGQPLVAESLYTSFLRRHPESAETWIQLGEVRFHWGAQLGMSAASAEEAFLRALALVPQHATTLTHAIRLAARRRDAIALDTLTPRLVALRPRGQEGFEARALHALAHRDTLTLRILRGEIGRLDANVARVLRNLVMTNTDLPALAVPLFADVATAPAPLTWNAHLAHGRYRDAEILVRSSSELAAWERAEYVAMQAVLPPRAADSARAAAAEALLQASPFVAGGGVADDVQFERSLHEIRAALLRGMLRLQQHDTVAVRAAVARLDSLAPQPWQSARRQAQVYGYAHESATLLRALLARSRPADALAALGPPAEDPAREWPHGLRYPSAFVRYLRAELLLQRGRDEEALRWFGTFPDNSGYDLAFIGHARYHAATILERSGDSVRARRLFENVAELWRDADDELQPLRTRAAARAATLQ